MKRHSASIISFDLLSWDLYKAEDQIMFSVHDAFRCVHGQEKRKAMEDLEAAWEDARTEKSTGRSGQLQAKYFAASVYDAFQILAAADSNDLRLEIAFAMACDGSSLSGKELADLANLA